MPASPTSEWICKPSPQPPPEAAAVEISGVKQLWGSQSWLPPAFSRRLEFLHFGTDFLTVPPRIDQAEAHALYQGMASAVPNRERNGALAPGDGETCTPCSSGQHPEFSVRSSPPPRPAKAAPCCSRNGMPR